MSAIDDQLLAVVLERLQPLPITARSMFGGRGLYMDGRFFGVIFDGLLYFRTDEASRASYTSRKMPALQPKYRPRGPKTVDRHFLVPPDVLAKPAALRKWARRAAEVKS
jgi:DNA transformation protein